MSVVPIYKQPATWTVGRLLREALVLCRLGASYEAAHFLGSDSGGTERDEALAGFVNFAIEEFYGDFPHLGLVASGSTTTASEPFSDLPANLHEADIAGIYWNTPGEARDGHKIIAMGEQDLLNLPPGIMTGEHSADWPDYYVITFDRNSGDSGAWRIRWIPTPSIARAYTIVHRPRPTEYTNATTDAAQIVPVPNSQIEPLVYLVAERIQIRNTGAKSVTPETLRLQYEAYRNKRAYKQPTDDELRNAAFEPVGKPTLPAWEQKASWEAMPTYDGDFS